MWATPGCKHQAAGQEPCLQAMAQAPARVAATRLAQDQTTTLDLDQATATRVVVDRLAQAQTTILGQNQTGADVHRLADRPMAQQQDQAQVQATIQDQDMAATAAVTKPLRQVAALQQPLQQQLVLAAVVTAPSTTGTRRRATMHRVSCAKSSMATGVDLRLARATATRDMVRTQA